MDIHNGLLRDAELERLADGIDDAVSGERAAMAAIRSRFRLWISAAIAVPIVVIIAMAAMSQVNLLSDGILLAALGGLGICALIGVGALYLTDRLYGRVDEVLYGQDIRMHLTDFRRYADSRLRTQARQYARERGCRT